MKYASVLTLTLLLLLLSPVAQNQDTANDGNNGNDLLPRCKAAVESADSPVWKNVHEAFSVGFCEGLVEGISYSSPKVCPTKGVTTMQSVRVVVKYLEDNPQLLNLGESVLTENALSKAFPCPK